MAPTDTKFLLDWSNVVWILEFSRFGFAVPSSSLDDTDTGPQLDEMDSIVRRPFDEALDGFGEQRLFG